MSDAQKHPPKPWRLDTNARYKDAVKIVMDLSTASLLLPIFFLRDILAIPKEQPLSQALNWKIYLSWIFLVTALVCGFVFYYASAKWVRLAWGKEAAFFRWNTNDRVVEKVLDISFLAVILCFVLGICLILLFLLSFRH